MHCKHPASYCYIGDWRSVYKSAKYHLISGPAMLEIFSIQFFHLFLARLKAPGAQALSLNAENSFTIVFVYGLKEISEDKREAIRDKLLDDL